MFGLLRQSDTRWARAVILFGVIFGLAGVGSGRAATPAPLSERELADNAYVEKLSEPGVPHTLDLSDPPQHRYLMRQLRVAGLTREVAPQLHRTLEAMRAGHAKRPPSQELTLLQVKDETGTVYPVNGITEVGTGDNTNYFSEGLSSVKGGTINTTLFLQLFNATTGQPIGSQATHQWFNQGEHLTLPATGVYPSAAAVGGATREVKSKFTYVYTPHTGNPVSQTVYLSTANAPKTPPQVTAPVQTPGKHSGNFIKVCLSRTQFADCDYHYTQGASSADVQLGVSGSIEYQSNVVQPFTAANSYGTMWIAKDTGGGCHLTAQGNFFDHVTVNGATLSWNFDPAHFGKACWQNGEQVTFEMMFGVTTANSGGEKIFAFVTNNTGCQSNYNTTCIEPLEFVWGCLLEGTRVRMADGSLRRIEDVDVDDRVLAGPGGRTLTVMDTIWGTEEIPLVILKDDQGHTLPMSEGHPVITERGVVLAKHLHVGDVLTTEDGTSRVRKIRRRRTHRKVYNLNLGKGAELATLTEENTTLFANGILVGDNQMQRTFGLRARKQKENVLDAIPKEWHQDYLSWLARQ